MADRIEQMARKALATWRAREDLPDHMRMCAALEVAEAAVDRDENHEKQFGPAIAEAAAAWRDAEHKVREILKTNEEPPISMADTITHEVWKRAKLHFRKWIPREVQDDRLDRLVRDAIPDYDPQQGEGIVAILRRSRIVLRAGQDQIRQPLVLDYYSIRPREAAESENTTALSKAFAEADELSETTSAAGRPDPLDKAAALLTAALAAAGIDDGAQIQAAINRAHASGEGQDVGAPIADRVRLALEATVEAAVERMRAKLFSEE